MPSDRLRLKLYLALFFGMLMMGLVGFMAFEGLSLIDALYFSIVTMATVGYGDIHPTSAAGKILALVLIVGGVGTFLGVVASITDIFLNRREEVFRKQKINMVTGLFFSELGTGLLKMCAGLDPDRTDLKKRMAVSNDWSDAQFKQARSHLLSREFRIVSSPNVMADMHAFLVPRSRFLLNMLENPALHEQGHLTDLLRAVFHFRDELLNREALTDLSDTDKKHLEGDIIRLYRLLALEWLNNMSYLKKNYAYMLSLAMRINPFDPEASAEVS